MKQIVIGMAHRGRLNVLAQVMGKPQRAIFHEFKGGSSTPNEVEGSGDVKYHLGASSDREFDGNSVHLSLTANPSHLEIVNPVVLGKVRQAGPARRHPRGPHHGDAAAHFRRRVLSPARGSSPSASACRDCAGTAPAAPCTSSVNNQIGSPPIRAIRASPYPSDVAKMIEAPIFHVNGDDPEAVVFAAKVATEFRQKFQCPVVIDMFCYRASGTTRATSPRSPSR